MLSVNNMLNERAMYTQYKRPAVLDISNLLCSSSENHEDIYNKSPSLSPSLTSSPASVSSYTSYPFPSQSTEHASIWEDVKKLHAKTMPAPLDYHTPISQPCSVASSVTGDKEVDELVDDDEDMIDSSASSVISDDDHNNLKAKRRRANAKQLEVLNRVFDRTFFPSTQMRAELGRQLGMSPRTVQIWFQNRRQAMRTRERQRLIRMRNDNKLNNTSKSSSD